MTIEEYAKGILDEHGCDEYTYGDESAENVLKDLKEAYPNGMVFGYVDVANTIKKMSKPHLIIRRPFCVTWETDSCCDGFDCDTFEEAKSDALETLAQWEMEEIATWKNKTPTEEEKENWDYMIYNCVAYVQKYNPIMDEYEEYWFPTDEELKEIGWVAFDEQD